MPTLALNPLKFQDIRNQIILYLNEKNEFGGQFDFANSNMSYFVDVMAYTTMLMSYNTTNVANNIFLDTTEIRKNAVSIAKQIGYKPKRPISAKLQGTLKYKGVNFNASNKLIIPARSPFMGSFGNMYFNTKAIELKYAGNPTELEGEYVLTEGRFGKYKIDGTGESNFSFLVNNKNIDEDNFSLYVVPKNIVETPVFDLEELANYIQYKWQLAIPFVIPTLETQSLTINNNTIYFMEEDITKEGYLKVVFGNGVLGKCPTNSDVIVCEYLETKGSLANNETLVSLPPADKLIAGSNTYVYYSTSELGEDNKNIFNTSSFDTSYQNQYNKSFGGSDIETIDSIKFNAPKFYSFVGRCVTKNDYMYHLGSLSEVKTCNVIGGDELFPNDPTKLGNIYITLVPNINDSEFLYGANIYVSDEMENDLKYKLDDISIISTKRQFYKPSYIIIDITPTLEFDNKTSVSEKNSISKQVKTLLMDYFADNYNTLGVKFRESKATSIVDTLPTIISSYFDLAYHVVINHNTVHNLVEDLNNFIIYLPIKDVKDELGNITGTTNFVKTNQDIVIQDILSGVDWTLLTKTDISESEMDEHVEKIKLMNNALLSMTPEQSSLFGNLIHPTLSRQIYSRDYIDTPIMKIWFVGTTLYSTGYNYIDRYGNDVAVDLYLDPNDSIYYIRFSLFETSTNTINTYKVARIVTYLNPNNIQIIVDAPEMTTILLEHFKIDDSNYVFNGSPFDTTQIDDTTFSVNMRMITETSDVAINGTNTVLTVPSRISDTATDITLDRWNIKHVSGELYDTIKYDATDVAYMERSHDGIVNASNKRFKGFINSVIELNTVHQNIGNDLYVAGDYFIINSVFYVDTDGIYSFYNKGDVYHINDSNVLTKSVIKKLVDSHNANSLITVRSQGDLYINDVTAPSGDYLIFDTTASPSGAYPLFSEVVEKPITMQVDSSMFLPKELENNTIVRVSIPDEVYSVGGYNVTYPDGITDKLLKSLYVRETNDTWTEISSKILYDGDVIVYKSSDEVHISGGWYLLENTIDPVINPTANARLNVRADNIITLSNLDSLKAFNRVLRIDTEAITIATNQITWFTTVPSDKVLNSGDLLICIDDSVTNGLWAIFDDDYFNFYIDIFNNASTFPEPLSFGDVYTVFSDIAATVTNFAGQTQLDNYIDGDKIIYYDTDAWKRFESVAIINNYTDTLTQNSATIGDLVQVTDIGGTFDNSSKIDAPKFVGNFLFNYNDMLYYTGTHWIKPHPINVYNNIEFDVNRNIDNDEFRKILNDAGFNSDFHVEFNTNNSINLILNDIYHDTIIGNFNYNTGKLSLNIVIDGYYNKIAPITDISLTKLSAIFKQENYLAVGPIQMDKITMKQTRKNSSTNETDFDTTFNQYIVSNILDAIQL